MIRMALTDTMEARQQTDSVTAFFASFILLTILYRLTFIYDLSIRGFMRFSIIWDLIFGFMSDLLYGALLALLLITIQSAHKKFSYKKKSILQKMLKNGFILCLLGVITLFYIIHSKIYSMFLIGLNYPIFISILKQNSLAGTGVLYATHVDWFFLLGEPLIFIIFMIM